MLFGKSDNLVFFNGHGIENSVLGFNNLPLFESQDCTFLKNSIAFLRCCYSINNITAKCAIGYCENFRFWGLNSMACRPLDDDIARPIFEISNLIAFKLLKGTSVQEALKASRRKARDVVKEILSKENSGIYDSCVIDAIVHNDLCLEATGDTSVNCF